MGLDAHVCCNCIKDGVGPPHPFPELLRFDETGEPTLEEKCQPSLEQWLQHDRWLKPACPHGGHLLSRRLGNIALIGYVRDRLGGDFPMIRERVVYSGEHSGDWISAVDSARMLEEAQALSAEATDPIVGHLANDLVELAEASVATGNPIVF